MPLDPQVRAMREQRAAAGGTPLYELTIGQARAEDLRSIREGGGDPEPVLSVVDDTIPGPGGDLPVRIYRPSAERPARARSTSSVAAGRWARSTPPTACAGRSPTRPAASRSPSATGWRPSTGSRPPSTTATRRVAWVAEHADDLGVDAGPARRRRRQRGRQPGRGGHAAGARPGSAPGAPAAGLPEHRLPVGHAVAAREHRPAAVQPALGGLVLAALPGRRRRRRRPARVAAARRRPRRPAAGHRDHRRVRPAARPGRGSTRTGCGTVASRSS